MLEFIVLAAIALAIFMFYRQQLRADRVGYIDSYSFPAVIRRKLIDKYPHLDERATALVIAGLQEFFQVCNQAGWRMVSMPSQAVDVAWHEFILHTREYEAFCKRALGEFLHHTPAEAMGSPQHARKGIKTAWTISCARENICAKRPRRLPLLFAIDTELAIPDGFRYLPNCSFSKGDEHCATHIVGNGGSCGTGGGCGGGGGDGGSSSSADGGSGCGGGGCGGD